MINELSQFTFAYLFLAVAIIVIINFVFVKIHQPIPEEIAHETHDEFYFTDFENLEE